jgi:cholesterol oxidase
MIWLVTRPFATLELILKQQWAERTILLIGMQRREGVLRVRSGKSLLTLYRPGLVSETVADQPAPPRELPEIRALAGRLAETTDGVVQTLIPSAFGITTTAHMFGGCIIGRGPDEGVVDVDQRVFGYENLYVCDGSVLPTNPGSTPTLTITALAERCMSKIQARDPHGPRDVEGLASVRRSSTSGTPGSPSS